jgi:hypothetical protein
MMRTPIALGLLCVLASFAACYDNRPLITADDDAAVPSPPGAAGTTGTARAGQSGSSTGAAGATPSVTGAAGGPEPACDVTPLVTKYFCSVQGACHDAQGAAANFDMASVDWQTRLVGVLPRAGGSVTPSVCATDPSYMNRPYIIKGSATGAGLFLDKLTSNVCSPGGMQMPNIGPHVDASDLACFQSWARALANQ